MTMTSVADFVGKTAISITGMTKGDDEIVFRFSDGSSAKLHHVQDCCESVAVEDVCGDVDDLIGSPFLSASEETEEGDRSKWGDSSTWTFYKFATIKGSVTLRWLGESNGYYSESVDFADLSSKS